MKISQITLRNFRSITYASFTLQDYSLLIGANNAGKSNIIDAIRIFYEHDKMKYSDSDECWFPDGEEVWIEIEYKLTDDEYNSLKEEYRLPDNKLKVRRYFKSGGKENSSTTKQGHYAYNKDGNICEQLFYGEKNVGSGKLGSLIYIPAQSNVEEQTKLTGPSPLRDLIADVLERVIEGSAAYDKLKTDLTTFSGAIKTAQTEDEKSLVKLQSEISDALQGWNTKFEFDFKTPDAGSIIKNLVSYKIGEAVEDMTPSQMGSGFQRHLIFSLIGIAAKYPAQKKAKKDKDFTPTMSLLLFEEPEAFLHPDQQLSLCRNLKSLASDQINQVLVSSHSPHFVSQNTDDISSIIKLNKPDKVTEVGQVSQEKWKEILEADLKPLAGVTDTREEMDKNEETEAIKYFLWLDPERSGCFFSKHVLLVEGPTEKGLFNYLIDKGLVTVSSGGVFILDSMGKFNMPKLMRLLEGLKIPHTVIFDDDSEKGEQKLWNASIKGSQGEFTKNIKTFSQDLEAMLGVDKPKGNHRKPQRLLYNWITEKIAEEKRQELLTILSSAIND